MKSRSVAVAFLSVWGAAQAQTPQVKVEIQKQFPGWSLVETRNIKKPLNANSPSNSSPGWVQYPRSSFALLFKESGAHRAFRLIRKSSETPKWAVIHQEDDPIDTAFCWIEPVSNGQIKDALGSMHSVDPEQSILFSFDRGYEAVFTFHKGKWDRIVTYTED